ncbi:MAG: T9SS type A sorting domain-containing protein, partial [Candidatus Cloacimonadaceae bacterium]|nr:T9SS type A sorting domain-containing protein [Candidatus Cloacimonadaceae bacterium]
FDANANLLYSNRSLVLEGGTQYVQSNSVSLHAGPGSEAWMLMHRRVGTSQHSFRALWLDAQGFAWSNDQEIHSSDHYYPLGSIGMGAIAQPSGLKVLAHHNEPGQSSILSFDLTTQQATPPSVTILQSPTAYLNEHTISPLGSNVLAAWIENIQPYLYQTRKDRVRYQISNQLGQKLMPQEGEIISGGTLSDLVQLHSLNLPDGNVLLWWVDVEPSSTLRAQMIAPDGSQLWEPGGRIMADGAINYQYPVLATLHQEDIYFAWVDGSSSIKGQRFSGGIPQWEAAGRLLIASANVLYLSNNGIKLEALEGDCLVYSCGGYYGGNWNCIALLRFDQNGMPQAGFGPGGNQVLYYSGNLFKSLRFFSFDVTPIGYLISAISYDGSIDYENNYPIFWMNGSAINFAGFDGVSQWEPNGFWDSNPWVVIATDDNAYYVNNYHLLQKKNWNGEVVWSQSIHSSHLQRAVETQPGHFIGTSDDRLYYTFSDRGSVAWPHDYHIDGNPLSLSGPIALGGDAYMSWKGNWFSYYNSNDKAILLLQRFSESLSPNGDPHTPALSDQISISSAPNPFRAQVSLQVTSKKAIRGEVSIYNLRGQKVRSLHNGDLPQGVSLINWDGRDSRGDVLGAGIYFCRINIPGSKPFIRKLMKL